VDLFDTHAHLDEPELRDDLDAVLARAKEVGVTSIVAIGTTADSSEASVEIAVRYSEAAARYPEVTAAVGIQPNYCGQAAPGDWDRIVKLVEGERVVAIGETGLDGYWDYTPLATQRDYFDRHLRLAQERGLPFVVHTRDSDGPVVEMLEEAARRGPLRGVMHSFTGSAATAARCMELGLYISFAGMVTFKKSDELRAVAATVPADRILIETDSPYLSPHPLRGRRNEPAHIVHTCACLAGVRGQTPDQFAEQTAANARRLFGRE